MSNFHSFIVVVSLMVAVILPQVLALYLSASENEHEEQYGSNEA